MAYNLLPGKTVIVSGSSTGIGRAIAIRASVPTFWLPPAEQRNQVTAKNGANVVLHHLGPSTQSDIEEVTSEVHKAGGKSVIVAGDIAEASTASSIVKAAIDTFGRIDHLISNAGICPFHPLLTLPADLWRRVQDVNLNGAFFLVQAVANQMATQELIDGERGNIIAISSISALMGGGEQCHYTPTKAGLKSLMESCAIALGPLGIRCNSVLPGTIETNINKEDLSDPVKRADQTRRVPLGRLGVPEDLAGPTIMLCSSLARYVNGASLLVDGGMAISLQ